MKANNSETADRALNALLTHLDIVVNLNKKSLGAKRLTEFLTMQIITRVVMHTPESNEFEAIRWMKDTLVEYEESLRKAYNRS